MSATTVYPPPEGMATYSLNPDVVPDSHHSYRVVLPRYDEKDAILRHFKDTGSGDCWPETKFSFNTGNFAGLKNEFTLRLIPKLQHPCLLGVAAEPTEYISASLESRIEVVPWQVNKEKHCLNLYDRRIVVFSRKDAKIAVSETHDLLPNSWDEKLGYHIMKSNHVLIRWTPELEEFRICASARKRPDAGVLHLMTEVIPVHIPISSTDKLFSKYFLSQEISDVQVKVGEQIFPGHRFVLMERSPVFRVMLQTEMTESRERCVKIEDYDSGVVEEFLEFLYTGSCKSLKDESTDRGNLIELYRMGHMYEVGMLKYRTEVQLKSSLSPSNVIQIYDFAKVYDITNLKAAAKEFFLWNKKSIVPDSKSLDEFGIKYSTELLHELLFN